MDKRRIAVMTSGGDAPGMNAAIRAVTRLAIGRGWEVIGVRDGFAGLMAGDMRRLGRREVGGVLHVGGTMLGSARAPEFQTELGQRRALEVLEAQAVDGLVVIGGNGSQQGSMALHQRGFPVVGIASTIDNDLAGSDITLGVDTALNTVLEALDRLRTTASSHRRLFLVETMGRDSGYLAMMAGIAGGAELIILPERNPEPGDVISHLHQAYLRKNHAVVVVAEGWRKGAQGLRDYLESHEDPLDDVDIRVTILGHIQRGGPPSYFDRLLGTRFGAQAITCLGRREHGVLVVLQGKRTCVRPLRDVVGKRKPLNPQVYELAELLAI